MNTTTVFLVRHAQTKWNVTGRYMGWIDKDLSKEGMRQAKQLSIKLEGQSIDSAYSSPLKRAYHTAQMTVAPHSLQVSPVLELGEIRLGAWEGLTRDEVKAQFPDIWYAWRSDPSTVQMPEGETMAQVQDRAVAAFQDIIRTNRGRKVLIVTHEVIVKLLVAYCLDVSSAIYRRFEVANASLTVIQIMDGMCLLRMLNDTSYLEAQK